MARIEINGRGIRALSRIESLVLMRKLFKVLEPLKKKRCCDVVISIKYKGGVCFK